MTDSKRHNSSWEIVDKLDVLLRIDCSSLLNYVLGIHYHTILQSRPPYSTLTRPLGNAKSLKNVRHAKSILDGSDGSASRLVEELVDGSNANAIHQHGDSLADGLDRAGLRTLLEEAEFELCEGNTEGILELRTC